MKYTVLASGSRGNMTYIELSDRNILIDAGISMLSAKKRKTDIGSITDIFITHEHTDHIKFLSAIAKKTNANIYINKKSFLKMNKKIREEISNNKIYYIDGDSHYKIYDNLDIYTFTLSHDSGGILGYIFKSQNKTLAYITDTGYFPVQYFSVVMKVDGLIIEANHNVEMLMNSDRDEYLKSRILSPKGHMSNYICYTVLKEIVKGKVKSIILAHKSEECNSINCINKEIIVPLSEIYKGEILIAMQDEAVKTIEL